MSGSGESELINSGFVKIDGRGKSYSVLFDDEGVKGVQLTTDQTGRPVVDRFKIPWADIRSVTRKSGIISWGMVLERASGGTCEIWVFYEHQSASFFGTLKEKFGKHAEFRAAPAPIWKLLALPVAIAFLCAGAGSWVYQGVRDAEARGELGRVHWLITLFGSSGVVVVFSFCVLFLIGYSVWLVSREIKARRRA